jgi:outer membrane immunogenic protein
MPAVARWRHSFTAGQSASKIDSGSASNVGTWNGVSASKPQASAPHAAAILQVISVPSTTPNCIPLLRASNRLCAFREIKSQLKIQKMGREIMKRILFAIAATTALCTSPSLAADLPVKAPVVPPAPLAYNWNGCYIGGNVGGTWGSSNVNIPLYPANFDIDSSSLIGGVHGGCNYMFAPNWVIGIEGDYAWTDLNDSASTINGPVGETFSVKWDAMATIRGRLGYAWNNSLFYVTGGVAWSHLDNAQYNPIAGGAVSATYTGWVVGAGYEYGFTPNWIAGVEYLYADLGDKDFVFLGPTSVSHTANIVRGRISYKF